jgi:hypothetical protein
VIVKGVTRGSEVALSRPRGSRAYHMEYRQAGYIWCKNARRRSCSPKWKEVRIRMYDKRVPVPKNIDFNRCCIPTPAALYTLRARLARVSWVYDAYSGLGHEMDLIRSNLVVTGHIVSRE